MAWKRDDGAGCSVLTGDTGYSVGHWRKCSSKCEVIFENQTCSVVNIALDVNRYSKLVVWYSIAKTFEALVSLPIECELWKEASSVIVSVLVTPAVTAHLPPLHGPHRRKYMTTRAGRISLFFLTPEDAEQEM